MYRTIREYFVTIATDRAVFYSLAATIAATVSGPITALLIVLRFSPTLQGYHYTFGSLVTLQNFLELGLTQVIVQYTAHEWVNIQSIEGIDSRKPETASSAAKLRNLQLMALRWFGIGSLFAIIVLLPAGFLLFGDSKTEAVHWKLPWTILCASASLRFILLPLFALIQGCGRVRDYWHYQFLLQVVRALVLWVAILAGARLWARTLASSATFLFSTMYLFTQKDLLVTVLRPKPSSATICWRREIFPLQWRVSLSALSTRLPLMLFIPLVFHLVDPVEAGRFGLSTTIGNVIFSLSIAFSATRAPKFGELVTLGETSRLHQLFGESVKHTLITSCLATAAVLVGVFLLHISGSSLRHRVLNPLVLSIYIITFLSLPIMYLLSTYFQAHRRQPLYHVFAATGALALLLATFGAKAFGTLGVSIASVVAFVLIRLPLSFRVFKNFRRQAHP